MTDDSLHLQNALITADGVDGEHQLRKLTSAAQNIVQDAAFLVLADGKLCFVNDQACKSLGYTRAELLNLNVTDFDADLTAGEMQEFWSSLVVGGPRKAERRHRAKDGRIFPVEVTITFFEFEGRGISLALARDISEVKAAQHQVGLLLTALDRVDETVVLMKEDSHYFIYANEGAARNLGYTREELTGGMGVFDIDVLRKADASTPLGISGRFESIHRRRDGHEFPVEITGNKFEFAGAAYYLAICRDISDRRRRQDELARTDRALRMLGACNRALIRIEDETSLLDEICRIAVEIGGYRLAWVGVPEQDESKTVRPVARFGHDDGYVDALNLSWAETQQGMGPGGTAIRTRKPSVVQDLTELPFFSDRALQQGFRAIIALPLISTEELFGAFMVYACETDAFDSAEVAILTELADDLAFGIYALRIRAKHVKAEQELQRAYDRETEILESISDNFTALDREWRFTYANEQATRSFGRPLSEILGKCIWELFPEMLGTESAFLVQQSMEHRVTTYFELFSRSNDAWMDGRVYPSAEGISIFSRDISDRKRADAERQVLEAQLRESQKMEAIGSLAGGIAHDFNNILGAILGNVELAALDSEGNEAALVSIGQIRSAAQRARDLTQQILYFGRRQPTTKNAVSLTKIVEESASLLRSTLPARIELVTHTPPAGALIAADATQLLQVLINLGANSAQAIGENAGKIEIEVGQIAVKGTPPRGLPELQPGTYAYFSVTDSGCGMDAATVQRVFEPFFTTKKQGEGTGLGLSVVHGIVKAHEGHISVRSELGVGTTFEVYLPAAQAGTLDRGSQRHSPKKLDGHGKHIMYIDDDEALIFLVSRLLKRQGFEVTGFSIAEDAMEALRSDPSRFDAVVTDLNMPGMSGIDVAIEVRKIDPEKPVALASGNITDDLKARAVSAGVVELIFKPNAAEEYVAAIQRLLS